jgi:hypothetical protein
MSNDETPRGPVPPAPPAPGASQEELPSLPSRIFGVFFSPGATFGLISCRPAWLGALVFYLVAIGLSTLVYSLNVDWETMWRGQLESSVAWKLASSVMPEGDLERIERTSLNEILSAGKGGMALRTTINAVIYSTLFFQIMIIVFATLFYLMGALADLKLGRLYLDAFFCVGVFILFTIVNAFVRGMFGENTRGALPYEAGIASLFFLGYFWLLYRSFERQPELRKFVSSYAHAMAIPAVASLLLILVVFLKSEPVTVPGDQVLTSSIGAILGMEGSGVMTVLLRSLDLFKLWELTAAAIGFAAVTRLSMGTTVAITFLPWGFYTMARVAMAVAFGG